MGQFSRRNKMSVEKLNDVATFIVVDMKKASDRLEQYKEAVISFTELLDSLVQKGALMYDELSDSEKAILLLQRPDIVQMFEAVVIPEVIEETVETVEPT